jgi:outer membrane receptor protein involved in Fe transport
VRIKLGATVNYKDHLRALPVRIPVRINTSAKPLLLLVVLAFCLAASPNVLQAQIIRAHYSGQVLGPANQPVPDISVQLEIAQRTLQAVTDSTGHFDFVVSPASTTLKAQATVKILQPGYAPLQQDILPNSPAYLHLSLGTISQRVVVTASKTALALDASANTVQVVSARSLQQTANVSLGDGLRHVTGLSPFRRSSALIANPTSQGVSLRGLGSTAASRTLVLADDIPINDPFGGWIYWDQIPSLAIQDVEVVRGGASDLYGSSAIGGVIHIIERPSEGPAIYAIDTGYAQENTRHLAVLGKKQFGPWSGLFAGDTLRTDGYIEVPEDLRGTVDTAANVHYENAELDLARTIEQSGRAFLRGNLLNEARGNGTPLQTNGTRLWRYSSGLDWTTENAGIFNLRLSGSQEHYRQSFSAIATNRDSEFLTRLQQVPIQQMRASFQWTRVLRPWLTIVAGADANDIRATDFELPIMDGHTNGLSDTTARQRDIGEYIEGLVQANGWTLSGSFRIDTFQNLDATQYQQTGEAPLQTTQIPNRSETLLNPKLGAVRHINEYLDLTASAYRAFRSPTLNELYRQGQVGQEITLANPNLVSERATGWETGLQFSLPQWNAVVRASYFWTEVNRPVTALTLNTTPTEVLNQRENLGQIRSRGLSLDYEAEPFPWLSVRGGYQYANATVTQFVQQPSLIGKWIPQVAHNMATMQVGASRHGLGTMQLLATESGRQYDDDANAFLLRGYFQLDGYVSHTFGSRFEAYAAIANIFDRSIQVGRTPILTLGTPRMASVGIRIHSRP